MCASVIFWCKYIWSGLLITLDCGFDCVVELWNACSLINDFNHNFQCVNCFIRNLLLRMCNIIAIVLDFNLGFSCYCIILYTLLCLYVVIFLCLGGIFKFLERGGGEVYWKPNCTNNPSMYYSLFPWHSLIRFEA